MLERFRPTEEPPLSPRARVERRFNKPSRLFDPELFMEGYDAISAEFEEADREMRRRILMERYFDTFEPVDDPEISDSQFEDRFIVRPPKRLAESEPGVREGTVAMYVHDPFAKLVIRRYGEITQYGPSRIFDLPPGNVIEVERLEPQDVVGTTALSACTAVVARNGERVLMAHVLGSDGPTLSAVLETARRTGYAADQTRMFSPYWTEPDGTNVASWNDRLARMAEANGVSVDWFPYIGFDVHNPDDIRHTTVLVGQDMLRSVGTSVGLRDKRTEAGAWYQQRRTIIRKNTIRDYE